MTPIGNKLYLKITNNCNLKCPFCYSPRIDKDLGCDNLDFYINKYNIENLVFHGGEPLLKYDKVKEIINKYNLNFHLVSNLCIDINKDIEYIISRCGLATSYSVDRFNQFTFNKWLKNIDYLHSINKNFTLIITLSEQQLNQSIESLLFVINRVNANYVSFERCHGNYNEDFYIKSDDYLCNVSKKISKLKNVNFLVFKKAIDQGVPCINYECEKTTFTLDYKNTVYTCPSLCEGSVGQWDKSRCLVCEYFKYCRGDCPSFRGVCAFPKKFFNWVKYANVDN